MADVQLLIAGKTYLVTCHDGEEAHLERLGAILDAKAKEAGGASGGLNESRLLLFAGLLLADELHDLRSSKTSNEVTPAPSLSDANSQRMAQMLEKLADRIESLAAGLE